MTMAFAGFPRDGLAFLAELAANNQRDWFAAHRQRFQSQLLEPAQAFVVALGERLRALAPAIHVDLRNNGRGTLMRLTRDTRFSRDTTPYKTELNGLFWEGTGEKTFSPAFGFRLQAEGMDLMAGLFQFPPPALTAYRAAVIDDQQGGELAQIIATLRARSGYTVEGEQYRRVPAGYDPQQPRADLLRYKGLYAHPQCLGVEAVCGPDLIESCVAHFEVMAPLQRWLARALDASAQSGRQ
jgi:uncharacterized protein (TIGR02453 family)